jgi:hypothetical protein
VGGKSTTVAQDKLALKVDALLSKENIQNAQLRKWRDMETQVKIQRFGTVRAAHRLEHMLRETRLLQGKAVEVRQSWLERCKRAKESRATVLIANANRDMIEGTWEQRVTDARRDYAEAIRTVHADLSAQSDVIRSSHQQKKLEHANECDCRDTIESITRTQKQAFSQQRKAVVLKAQVLRLSHAIERKQKPTTSTPRRGFLADAFPRRKQTVKFDLPTLSDLWNSHGVPLEYRLNLLFEFLTCEDEEDVASDVLAYMKSEEQRLTAMHKIQSTPTLLEPLVDVEVVGITSTATPRIAKLKDMRRHALLGLSRQAYDSALAAQEKIRRDAR